MTAIDKRLLRNALGAFATGVTIITAHAADGRDVALTASSFNSVSLDPPLVLWSLARSSGSLDVFMQTEHFAVHVLAADQQALSDRFARPAEDRFAGLTVTRGIGDVPMLDGCAGRFQCRIAFRYDGGDHLILVGEVLAFDHAQRPPLIFHGGSYGLVVPRPRPKPAAVDREPDGAAERRRMLTYLLAVANELVAARIREEYRQARLDEQQYFVLSSLEMNDGARPERLAEMLRQTGRGFDAALLDDLVGRGLVDRVDGTITLSPSGRVLAERLGALIGEAEARTMTDLDEAERLQLQLLLRKIIRRALVTDADRGCS